MRTARVLPEAAGSLRRSGGKVFNVGMVGTGFMAKAHSEAYMTMPMCFPATPARLHLKAIADVSTDLASAGAERFGFEEAVVGWEELVSRSDIDIVSILTPNNSHKEIAVAAARAGKHIICEKPMAMSSREAEEMYRAAKEAGVKNLLSFNYHRTPAVLEAKKIIGSGEIGKPLFFRGFYLQDWAADPRQPLTWRFQSAVCGTGTLGDICSHVLDLAQFLVGDIEKLASLTKRWIDERPLPNGKGMGRVDVDDEVALLAEFSNGCLGSIQSTRFAPGRKNYLAFELNCSAGSLLFDYQEMNSLNVCSLNDPASRQGFKKIMTGPAHPYGEGLWPVPALGIGYTETKIIEIYDFVRSIVDDTDLHSNFFDGWKNHLIMEAVVEADKRQAWVPVPKVSP
jgi:predicted dehydrogenase